MGVSMVLLVCGLVVLGFLILDYHVGSWLRDRRDRRAHPEWFVYRDTPGARGWVRVMYRNDLDTPATQSLYGSPLFLGFCSAALLYLGRLWMAGVWLFLAVVAWRVRRGEAPRSP